MVHCKLPVGNGKAKSVRMRALSLWKLEESWRSDIDYAYNNTEGLEWDEAVNLLSDSSVINGTIVRRIPIVEKLKRLTISITKARQDERYRREAKRRNRTAWSLTHLKRLQKSRNASELYFNISARFKEPPKMMISTKRKKTRSRSRTKLNKTKPKSTGSSKSLRKDDNDSDRDSDRDGERDSQDGRAAGDDDYATINLTDPRARSKQSIIVTNFYRKVSKSKASHQHSSTLNASSNSSDNKTEYGIAQDTDTLNDTRNDTHTDTDTDTVVKHAMGRGASQDSQDTSQIRKQLPQRVPNSRREMNPNQNKKTKQVKKTKHKNIVPKAPRSKKALQMEAEVRARREGRGRGKTSSSYHAINGQENASNGQENDRAVATPNIPGSLASAAASTDQGADFESGGGGGENVATVQQKSDGKGRAEKSNMMGTVNIQDQKTIKNSKRKSSSKNIKSKASRSKSAGNKKLKFGKPLPGPNTFESYEDLVSTPLA